MKRLTVEEAQALQAYKNGKTQIHYDSFNAGAEPVVIWAHGWGQNHAAFMPFMDSLGNRGRHILIDAPGFGASPVPQEVWSTTDYADAMADFIKSEAGGTPVIWVGHSFGCRVGLQMAARHPNLIRGLFLISAAGLKRQRPLHRKASLITAKIYFFKLMKKLIPLGLSEEWLKQKFGSADYRNAGPMRDILVKTVNEDLSDIAKTITCPVKLAYGTLDFETPVEIGERLSKLIPNAELITLENLDHYTILGSGRHQVTPHLKKFIEQLSPKS